MVLLRPDAEEDTVGSVLERITGIVSERGGEVGTPDRWGKRKLAYEIDHHTEGHYVVLPFTAGAEALAELDRVLSLADEVMRFKVVRAAA